MFVQADHHKNYVTKRDLIVSANDRAVRWLGPSLHKDDDVLRGAIGFLKIEDGLSVHYSNAEDLHDLKIETDTGPSCSLAVFLEGSVDAFVGSFQIPMPTYDTRTRNWIPVATLFSQKRPEKFVRQARRGNRLKKVTISMSHEWLLAHLDLSDPGFSTVVDFMESHLANFSWTPSAHTMSLVEQIIATSGKSSFHERLYATARVYGLLEDAFRQFSEQRAGPHTKSLSNQDRQRLKAVESFLSLERDHWITAKELAVETGMSETSLQRLLTRCYGLSTSRFIRRFMLERAREALERDGVTIAEAAHLGGYSSPANFSTAFKREFGLSPGQVI